MKKIKLVVRNLYCSDCSESLKSELKKRGANKVDIKIDNSDIQKIKIRCGMHPNKKEILEALHKRGIDIVSRRRGHANHMLKMILACLIPMILLFVLPIFGMSKGLSSIIAIILMILLHLFMMRE